MTLAEAVLVVMWIGLTAYAVFGGADFGGGFWDLLAGDAEGGRPTRALVAGSIGPVWEANHVWLIFVLVVLFSGFPTTFASVMSTLYIPLTAAAIGIILRGSGFAFRKVAGTVEHQRLFGAMFAASSVITPFFLGAVAGGVASGRVPVGNASGDPVTSWVNPTSVLGGTLAVASCAFLAAVFLCRDADHAGADALAAMFRQRALVTGTIIGAIALAGIGVIHSDAPQLFHGLTHRGLPLVVLSAVAGLATLWLLWRRRFTTARISAALAVVAVVWGWAAGQYPYLLIPELTIDQGAGADATLGLVLAACVLGAVVLVPSLTLLLRMTQRGDLT